LRTLFDYARLVFISPELLAIAIVVVFFAYFPEPFEFLTRQLASDVKWGLGAAALPLGMLGACYKIGTELLSPQGKRLLLLDWPDYPYLTRRVVFTLVACFFGFILVVSGLYLVAKYKLAIGTMLIAAGVSSSAAALATIALAKWRARELLRE